ncbi:MAG: GNAT family N-acetyltransferase [Caulobacteraceae bacterium]
MTPLSAWQPRLQGERLLLRPVTPQDWAPLYALGSDPLVWEAHPASDRWREPVFRAYFEDGLASGGALVAEEAASGAVIGWSRYSGQYVDPGEVEIGWTFLGRDWWGGVYNGEMKRLMLAHAFRYVDRVILRIGETNGRSRRAAEKIGARLQPGRTGEEPTPGVVHLFYAVEKADFIRAPAPGSAA